MHDDLLCLLPSPVQFALDRFSLSAVLLLVLQSYSPVQFALVRFSTLRAMMGTKLIVLS